MVEGQLELPVMEKKPWMSKTIWANMLMAILALIGMWVPKVSEIVTSEMVMMLFAMINMILRLVTKDKMILW